MVIHFSNEVWSTIGLLDEPDYGSRYGTLLVMFHGGGGNKTGYRNTFAKLSREANSIGLSTFRFDLPGSGESVILESDIDEIKAIFDLISYVKQKYKYNNIYFVGHCWGGFQAMKVALLDPAMINGMVLWHLVPILYGLEEDLKFPRPRIRSSVSLIWSYTKNVGHSSRELQKALTETTQLTKKIFTYPIEIFRYIQTRTRHGFQKRKHKPLKLVDNVLVIVSPSRTHYANIRSGIDFIRNILHKMHFPKAEFAENNNKVFSTGWQKIAFEQTLRHCQ